MQCGVRVDGATKVQRVDDAAWGQVEHVADGGGEDGVVRDAGAMRVDGHVGRFGDANPVGEPDGASWQRRAWTSETAMWRAM